jgi:glycosyltransferase involved in cell wall biosynthesis
MKNKICFFIARHSHSGVPLAQIRLAKALARRGYQITFIIGYLPEDITLPAIVGSTVINLNQSRTIKLLLPIIAIIKDIKPDIIFSAEDHLNAVVSLGVIIARSRATLSVSSRVTPYDVYSNRILSKGWVLKLINPMLWPRANALTCVSYDMVKQYHAIFGKTRHQAIYNIIVDSDLDEKMLEEVDHVWFSDASLPIVIAAGRLAPEKGFADLIRAIKLVNDRANAKLVILGDGPLKSELQRLIENLRLADKVQLLGFQYNPYKFFAKAQVFVLSSYVEGMPNVLVEAMACGCAVIATDCPTGPREALRDGQFGELVPMRSPEAIAAATLRALTRLPDPDKLAEAVLPFTEDQVIRTYQRVLGLS